MNLEWYREAIEEQYAHTEQGADFGVILCHELHTNDLTFIEVAKKWSISLTLLGLLIADHCARLEIAPK